MKKIILPLILWLNKKDKIIGLKKIGANLLNFQMVWTIVAFTSISVSMIFKIQRYGNSTFLLYIFFGLYALNIILPIVFAFKTNTGKTGTFYPNLIKLIR